MPISPFAAAVNQLADERGLPKEVIIEAIETAVAAAYRKEYGRPDQNIRAALDEESGQFNVWQVFDIVEEVETADAQLTLEEGRKLDKRAELGGQVETELESHSDFGRIAAQTAKQVVSQKLREAEREILFAEYKEKENQLVNGYVQQVEGPNVIMNLGKLNGLMIASDQIPGQPHFPGQRLKVLLYSVEDSPRGPRVLVTRSSPDFIAKLFELEVPEIATGSVTIRAIAREAGTRTKIAVEATQPGLDPVGSCVGQHGNRVRSVNSEIGEEKIDITPWSGEIDKLIVNALSPAKVSKITLKKRVSQAIVEVTESQLPLAIGKNGQNVRLVSKLTGWVIDIVKEGGRSEPKTTIKSEPIGETPVAAEKNLVAPDPVLPKKPLAKPKKKKPASATKKSSS